MTDYRSGEAFALEMDARDHLTMYREKFHLPKSSTGEEIIYFVGNSLGLQPTGAMDYIQEEMEEWKTAGAGGHHSGKRPWGLYETTLTRKTAQLVGAKPSEVVVMNSLTVNLHLLMVSFYRPTKERYKIMVEAKAFPSDQYAVASQLSFHGYDPVDGIVQLEPRNGETAIRSEDIMQTIEKEGKSVDLILIGGVNYYSGQFFNIKEITDLISFRANRCFFSQ